APPRPRRSSPPSGCAAPAKWGSPISSTACAPADQTHKTARMRGRRVTHAPITSDCIKTRVKAIDAHRSSAIINHVWPRVWRRARPRTPKKFVTKNRPSLSDFGNSAAEEVTMAVSRRDELPELLRWVIGHNPNPPDPALALILETANPQVRQQVLGGLARMNVAVFQAQVEFWTGVERAV